MRQSKKIAGITCKPLNAKSALRIRERRAFCYAAVASVSFRSVGPDLTSWSMCLRLLALDEAVVV